MLAQTLILGSLLLPSAILSAQAPPRPKELRAGLAFVPLALQEDGPPRWVQTTETPRSVWREVMGTEPWKVRDNHGRPGDNLPAAFVSWNEVQVFLQRLNEADLDHIYRLPEEAEWEGACRAGTGSDPGPLTQVAWFADNAFQGGEKYTHPVALKAPNAWGLYDCLGNVWEWVADGTEEGHRVLKGGSWRSRAEATRSQERNHMAPDQFAGDLGFRLVATPVEDGLWSPWQDTSPGGISWRLRWVASEGPRARWMLNLRNSGPQPVEVLMSWGWEGALQTQVLTLDPQRIHAFEGTFLRTAKGQRPRVQVGPRRLP